MAHLMMKVHARDKGERFSQSLLDVDDNQFLEPEIIIRKKYSIACYITLFGGTLQSCCSHVTALESGPCGPFESGPWPFCKATTTLKQATYPSNVLKALPEMRLHRGGILSLRQNLQQLIVRQEVESWEGVSLGLQVLAEAFLHLLQEFVALTQVVQQPVVGAQRDHLHNSRALF